MILSRLEDEDTGEILPDALRVAMPPGPGRSRPPRPRRR